MLAGLARRAWESPTLMTWGGTTVRMSGLLIIIPLVMHKFSVAEFALWMVFSTILATQAIVDFGFSATFMRFVAYSRGRASDAAETTQHTTQPGIPQQSNSTVIANMRYVYFRLTLLWFALLVLAGSFVVAKPIMAIEAPAYGWAAWLIMAVSVGICFQGGMYVSYLRGMERIALNQRWEIALGLATIIASCAVLLAGGGILELSIANQLGGLARLYVNRRLAIALAPAGAWRQKDTTMVSSVWAAAWRSGLGILATTGTIQISGLIYAQLASPEQIASYLLALQLVQRVRVFANVPFYTRIPDMSRMFAAGNHTSLVQIATRGMLLSTMVYMAGALAIGFGGEPLLILINSNTDFVPTEIWWLLSLAILLELVGAMHIQLYSTTNHIVWHIANGLAGLIMLICIPFAYHALGLAGLPVGIFLGYALFYVPYSMKLSYRAFELPIMGLITLNTVAPVLIISLLLLFTILEA